MPGHLGVTRSSPGGCVCLVTSYSHVVGYPVEPHPPPLHGEALQATQDNGDQTHIVAGMQLLESLWSRPGVVEYHGGLQYVERVPGPDECSSGSSVEWSSGLDFSHTPWLLW